MTDADWLAGLKVGDRVTELSFHVACAHCGDLYEVKEVTRVANITALEIVTESGGRWRRSDGKLSGGKGSRSRLIQPTAAQARNAKR